VSVSGSPLPLGGLFQLVGRGWPPPRPPPRGPPMTRSVVPGKAGLGIGLMVPDHWAGKGIRLLAGFAPPDSDSLLFPSGYWCSGVSAARMGPDEGQTARMAGEGSGGAEGQARS